MLRLFLEQPIHGESFVSSVPAGSIEPNRAWERLRLRDRIAPNLRVLFVGINPGVRSATTGHHFAGYSNRFWSLLWDSRLVPERVRAEDDDRLIAWGYGVTNLVARPSPGIDALRPHEYVDGWRVLEKKIRRHRPRIVAFVGVTAYRAVLPLIEADAANEQVQKKKPPQSVIGLQRRSIHGSQVFVLPNPSGRNANFTYAEMLAAFRKLRRLAATG
jgi:TDG/mug DNA glycosylase family protein